ncbi:hypothetical protein KSX_26740 [Ktedonospora formicarum]|uniref:Uncharacterized protein n=1 Tax=Ktedonospora formicarum TaxID=2778364 RepID=A0A8J3HWH4_9CHLR|nr:hypothetical protein KSX_26740 [Ktedonospora formicarum]
MMDTTPTPDSSRSRLDLACNWRVRERHGDEWHTVVENHNLFTEYGLTGLASAVSGGYIANNLVINTTHAVISGIDALGGTSLVSVDQPIDQNGDTQLVLSPELLRKRLSLLPLSRSSLPTMYTHSPRR